jgi:hypothetical protein
MSQQWREDTGVRCCVPDGVAGPQADPLGNGTVLLLRAGKLLLGAEGLLGLQYCQIISIDIVLAAGLFVPAS